MAEIRVDEANVDASSPRSLSWICQFQMMQFCGATIRSRCSQLSGAQLLVSGFELFIGLKLPTRGNTDVQARAIQRIPLREGAEICDLRLRIRSFAM
jgi:hypothetical protein